MSHDRNIKPGAPPESRARVALAFAALACVAWNWLEIPDADIERGNRAFVAAEYTRALNAYRSFEGRASDGRVQYNIGAAHYRLAERIPDDTERERHLQRALDAFQRASASADSSGKPELVARARFAAGNTRFLQADYAGAIKSYKATLRANPAHDDARYNLELAYSRLPEEKTDRPIVDRSGRSLGKNQPHGTERPFPAEHLDHKNDRNVQAGQEFNPDGTAHSAVNANNGNLHRERPDRTTAPDVDASATQAGRSRKQTPDATSNPQTRDLAHGSTAPTPNHVPETRSHSAVDEKLDGLERLSRDLRHKKWNRSARDTRRGRPKRDW